ncbi:hypothetical protein NEOLI_002774 [Neolecta irregularis DAH-3]|uniref:Uncharacterized protein n=1 Tax=Neolecta irregularis (strain DAH-3) TaxID=1198029 RepID=A0A1U7LQQ3_NEOID|nr:hypothetical protein NEOLI_002774 [Neolecta irregularis DAH-3]|eukprot:OLL24958.1 hypothetical protein NEOLI_002774 [Neolecta irregularis DAH-3]
MKLSLLFALLLTMHSRATRPIHLQSLLDMPQFEVGQAATTDLKLELPSRPVVLMFLGDFIMIEYGSVSIDWLKSTMTRFLHDISGGSDFVSDQEVDIRDGIPRRMIACPIPHTRNIIVSVDNIDELSSDMDGCTLSNIQKLLDMTIGDSELDRSHDTEEEGLLEGEPQNEIDFRAELETCASIVHEYWNDILETE